MWSGMRCNIHANDASKLPDGLSECVSKNCPPTEEKNSVQGHFSDKRKKTQRSFNLKTMRQGIFPTSPSAILGSPLEKSQGTVPCNFNSKFQCWEHFLGIHVSGDPLPNAIATGIRTWIAPISPKLGSFFFFNNFMGSGRLDPVFWS